MHLGCQEKNYNYQMQASYCKPARAVDACSISIMCSTEVTRSSKAKKCYINCFNFLAKYAFKLSSMLVQAHGCQQMLDILLTFTCCLPLLSNGNAHNAKLKCCDIF